MTKPNLIESQKTRLELRTGVGPIVWSPIVELTDVPALQLSRPIADVTTLDDSFKRIDSTGVVSVGDLEFKGLALAGNALREDIKAALISGEMLHWRVVLTDDSYDEFDAVVTSYKPEVKTGDKVRLSFTLAVDGAPVAGSEP